MRVRSITDSIADEVSDIEFILEEYFCERFDLTPRQAGEYFDVSVTVSTDQVFITVATDLDPDEFLDISLELDTVVESIQPGCYFVEERPGVWVCGIYLE